MKKTAESFLAEHTKLVGKQVGLSHILPCCQYAIKLDRKTKHVVLCGWGSEAQYKIQAGICIIVMPLCSKHATQLQQQNPHWKFYRLEK